MDLKLPLMVPNFQDHPLNGYDLHIYLLLLFLQLSAKQ